MYFDTSSDTNAVFLRPLLNGVNFVGSLFFYPTEMYSCYILSVLVSLHASFTDRVHVQCQECVQIKTSVTSWLSDLNCYFLEIVNTDNFNFSWKRNKFCNVVNDFV